MTEKAREDAGYLSAQFAGLGVDMLAWGLILGGGAFFFQWAAIFIAIAIALHSTVNAAANIIDWTYDKMTSNPFKGDK